MSNKDYYQILGLAKNASQADIKKAYKKLAVEWHPDKNPNNRDQAIEKFREISEAYQTLSDSKKRKIYDSSGFVGHKGDVFSHFNFAQADKLFSDFFQNNPFDNDDDDFFSSFFNRRKGQKSSGNVMSGGLGSSFKDGFFSGSMFDNEYQFDNYKGYSGVGKSISTFTKIVNGKAITTKKTTITKQDGSKQVTEEVIDSGQNAQNKSRIGQNDLSGSSRQRLKN